MRTRMFWLVIASLFLAQASAAVPMLSIQQEGIGTWSSALDNPALGCGGADVNGVWTCDGSGMTFAPANPDYSWEISNWSIVLDEDPFVSSVFGFTNTGVTTATFTITVSLPIAPQGPSTLMGGSTGGSITDANFDGLGGLGTVSATAFYTGMIDGALVSPTAELHPDPFSLGFAFPGATTSIPSASFGLPGPTVPGPAVATSIGIQNKFTLSAGDLVASTNFFVVEPIPEPTTGLLLSAGLLGLALYRRRARA